MSEREGVQVIQGCRVSLIGRAGKKRQHRVYSVIIDGVDYSVIPAISEVTTIGEIRNPKGQIKRFVRIVKGWLKRRAIYLANQAEAALKYKYTPE